MGGYKYEGNKTRFFNNILFVSSCGMKSITLEYAIQVYKGIVEGSQNPEREKPKKITAEDVLIETFGENSTFEVKRCVSHDKTQEKFYMTEHFYRKIGKETVEFDSMVWSWKEADKYYYATCETDGKEKNSYWCYSDKLRTNGCHLDGYFNFSINLATEKTLLKTEDLKKYGEDASWSFKSSGNGSILQEVHGENGIIEEKTRFNQYLLNEYLFKKGNTTEQHKLNWGKSSFKKPDIKKFQYNESIAK